MNDENTGKIKSGIRKTAVMPIKAYQMVSARKGYKCCKYSPSCSHYAVEAVERHGVFKGLLLSVWRILRCNPFSKGGYDPVPLKFGPAFKKRSN